MTLELLKPLLESDDVIIDGGNEHFLETRRREQMCAVDWFAECGKKIHFVGMGISGGAEGARHGPALMPGGSEFAYNSLKPMLEAMSAKAGEKNDEPCVTRCGPDGCGHYVKMVHNGIEYADMQMISEIYGLLRDQGGQEPAEIGQMFERWATGPLSSYLIEISGAALQSVDSKTGQPMVDVILDKAGQKGTGRWTLVEALKLGQSASTIEASVGARGWSSEKDMRVAADPLLEKGAIPAELPTEKDMENAMMAARILGHAQGFRILSSASEEFDWALDMARIAEIWRAGCIIRSSLLDEIAAAFRAELPFDHLILAPAISELLALSISGLRRVVAVAALTGQPVPALSAALAWHDTMALGRGTANMIQAQRDFFGAHGFERMDGEGKHHGDWNAV